MVKFTFLSTEQTGEAPKVFVSYRRKDSPHHAARLRDRLNAEFGPDCAGIYFYYYNEDRPGVKDALQNWDRLIMRFQNDGRSMPFRLRVGDTGSSIRVSVGLAPEHIFPEMLPAEPFGDTQKRRGS